ncbi:MAG: TIGR03643 family protein [Verrucomicrobiota bacterium]
MDKKKLKSLSQEQVDQIIRLAWADRISFEEIRRRTSLSEAEVILVMRRNLKPSSFRLWRKRVSGRVTKHRRRAKDKQGLHLEERLS